jgi:hypothetical protein
MTLHRPLGDGWLGTRELPGYRAGSVVVKLDDLPEVDPAHLYFDLLLLDGGGRPQQTHSGPCPALARTESLDQRSRFVRVVAEVVRHTPGDDRGLSAIAPALDFMRTSGIAPERLATAVQLLDNASSESAVVSSLKEVLALSLGEEEAHRALSDIVSTLVRASGRGTAAPEPGLDAPPAALAAPVDPIDLEARVSAINAGGLAVQLSYVVHAVGKARARRYLRDATAFDLLPRPDMFGV